MNTKAVRSLLLAFSALCLVAGRGTPALAQTQESLLDFIPDRAVGALVVRRNALGQPRQWLDKMPELRADLSGYTQRLWGVDVTQVEGMVAFSNNMGKNPTFAVVLRLPASGPTPTLKGKRLKRILNTDLIDMGGGVVAASIKGGLVLGNEGEVQSAVALQKGKGRPLSASSQLQVLSQPDALQADVIAAVLAPAIDDRDIKKGVEQFGIQTATLHFRKGGPLTFALSGDPTKLAQAKALFQLGVSAAMAKLKGDRDEALSGNDPVESLPKIAAYHYAQSTLREVEPQQEGNQLVVRYKLPQLDDAAGTVMSLAGVLAAVAIPSFTRYALRSKTTEVTVNLRRIADSAVSYYESEQASDKGAILPKHFPPSTEWTPPTGCCRGEGQRCAPNPKLFQAPGWQALNFSLDDPHYYQYRFTSKGQGKDAHFTIEARGDLNCNGVFSSFKREGAISPDGSVKIGPVQSENELE